jgi:saccharopine dehydrogenase (NAD+, L-lysine-forming)
MKVLLVGVGGVGEAIAVTAMRRPWLEKMVLADYNLVRALEVREKLGEEGKFPIEQIDAGDKQQIIELARKHKVDLLMAAVNVDFTDSLFEAAFEYGCNYMDMAMTGPGGAELGSRQLSSDAAWKKKGLLAILCMGVDPGLSDIFAKYAELHLFDEIEEIGVRDGASLEIAGYDFAPTFSIADALDECTSLPIIWEKDKGWFTTELFSEPEIFEFPEGIGPLKCVNVEHEEVVLIPRRIKTNRVTFKYALDDRFINAIKVLDMLGLTSKEPVNVKGKKVVPSEVVAACLPDPAHLGDKMTGKTCVGTWVKGIKDGRERQVYLYQSADNAESMGKYGCQAVTWQTGVCPTIAMELLAEGIWKGKGVLSPEAFDPVPFMNKMSEFDFPYVIKEM